MIFLNPALLAGLAAIAIPVLIHLIHRRQARVMDWAAMRFLLRSAAARRRRTIIEELILMVLRCLLVALLVMAMARPFLPASSRIPWTLVLPAVLTAAVLVAVGAVAPATRAVRLALFAVAGLLVAGAVTASAIEYLAQERRWSATADAQDVAVIVDGSMSMTVLVDARSNFDRAVDEARAVVAACRPADTVSLVLAGPAVTEALLAPTTDRALALAALAAMRPVDGPMDVPAAVDAAAGALALGQNPLKKIVLITDGQEVGWDAQNRARWQFVADGLDQLPGTVGLVLRTLPLPEDYANLAIGGLTLSRAVVGTDRPVGIDVQVLNTGTLTAAPVGVVLTVGGDEIGRAEVGALRPGAAETVRFDYRFRTAGTPVLTARLAEPDDLPADNTAVRAVRVLAAVPVLIVDGAPSSRPLGSPADFLALAMAPVEEPESDQGFLIEPTIIPVTELHRLTDLGQYKAVILSNVARLPSLFARTLAMFVREGGGLLVAPGERADAAFYDEWRLGGSERVMPGRLAELVDRRDAPATLDRASFAHPVLSLAGQGDHSDADAARLSSHWRLDVEADDPTVRVGGALGDGSPFLLERRLGSGFVLAVPVSLGRRDSNLPTLQSYVPLIHELVYYLAQPTLAPLNVPPGMPVTLDLPAGFDRPQQVINVLTPSGRLVPVVPRPVGDGWRVSFSRTTEPGLHQVTLGDEDPVLPFVVLGDAQEGVLAPVSDADLERLRRHVSLFRATTTRDMTAALSGDVPGTEVWRQLAACALLIVLAEIAVARWITMQRRVHSAEEVDFVAEAADPRRLWDRLRPRAAAANREGSEAG